MRLEKAREDLIHSRLPGPTSAMLTWRYIAFARSAIWARN